MFKCNQGKTINLVILFMLSLFATNVFSEPETCPDLAQTSYPGPEWTWIGPTQLAAKNNLFVHAGWNTGLLGISCLYWVNNDRYKPAVIVSNNKFLRPSATQPGNWIYKSLNEATCSAQNEWLVGLCPIMIYNNKAINKN